MLSTPEAAHQVFHQHDGILQGLQQAPDASTKGLVDCATLGEDDMAVFAKAVQATGARFLEAPVSGSRGPAAQVTDHG